MALRVGDRAPEFDVRATDGRRVRLSDYRGEKNVVLYFYPRAFTRVCTAETCGFRDMFAEMTKTANDVEVIGVSLDDDEKQGRFADQYKVTFPLVADHEKVVASKYGAVGALRGLLGLAKRVTYVIDKAGVIAAVLTGEMSADVHVEGVERAIAALRTNAPGASPSA